MRIAIRIALLLLLPASFASADSLQLSRTSMSMDDLLIVTIVVDDAPEGIESLRLPLEEGLALVKREQRTDYVPPMQKRRETLTFVVRALRPGTLRVGPVQIPRAGVPTRLLAKTVEVAAIAQPARIDSASGVSAALATQPQGQKDILLNATDNGPDFYVGQQVMVGWNIASKDEIDGFDVVEEPRIGQVALPVATSVSRQEQPFPHTILGVRRYVFYPEEPGRITIPPLTVRIRLRETDLTTNNIEVVRTSRPIVINVKPLPADASPAAVGRFDVDCRAIHSVDGGWQFEATVRGNGNLFSEVAPSFAEQPDYPTEIVRTGGVVTHPAPGMIDRSQQWTVRIPPAETRRVVAVPDLLVKFFNPQTKAMEEARCEGKAQLELQRRMPAAARKAAPATATATNSFTPPPPAAKPPSPPVSRMKWVKTIGGLIALLFIGYTVLSFVRR